MFPFVYEFLIFKIAGNLFQRQTFSSVHLGFKTVSNFETTGIGPTSQPITIPKIKTYLSAVIDIRIRIDGHMDTHTRPITKCTTGIGSVVNNNRPGADIRRWLAKGDL